MMPPAASEPVYRDPDRSTHRLAAPLQIFLASLIAIVLAIAWLEEPPTNPPLAAAAPPQRVIAPPVKPAPAVSDVVRFRFRHAQTREQTASGFKELPQTECGELLLERNTGRCVYRYWYDGVHERPSWMQAPPPLDQLGNRLDRVNVPLKGAAAFDGKRYWAASYNPSPPRRHADRVTIYKDADDLRSRDRFDKGMRDLPCWYRWAPLHCIVAAVDCDSFERDKVHRAFQALPQAQKRGPDAYSLTVLSWRYTVSLDNSEFGIRYVSEELAGAWMGSWPYALPSWYSMDRENAPDIDPKKFDSLTDVAEYVDDRTVVTE